MMAVIRLLSPTRWMSSLTSVATMGRPLSKGRHGLDGGTDQLSQINRLDLQLKLLVLEPGDVQELADEEIHLGDLRVHDR